MRFAVEHNSVLKLETGPDHKIWAWQAAIAAGGLLAGLFSPLGPVPKITLMLFYGISIWLIHRSNRWKSPKTLWIFPDGRTCWRLSDHTTGHGCLSANAWLSSHYAVITACEGKRLHRFVISRSLQKPDGFRVLRSWLHHGLPRAGGHENEAA